MSDVIAASIFEHLSPAPFDATLERLARAMDEAGMTIFARIDHAAAAQSVGMSLPPTTVLIYGSPRGGTPIMAATPLAALDLPLRVLVREHADGTVAIAFHPVADMLTRAGVPEDAATPLAPAQQMLIKALT